MVTKVKCVTKGCEWENQVFPVTVLFINRIAPLDGPYPCPKCDQEMKVVARVLASYKPGSGAKAAPRRAASKPTKKAVGKKKFKGIKVKMSNPVLGGRKSSKKPSPKKPGPRKRGPGK